MITKVKEDVYDVIGATGREVRGIKAWHLYETRAEAEKQSMLNDTEKE